MTVLGGGAFGSLLSQEGGALVQGISALIKGPHRSPSFSSTIQGYIKQWALCTPEEGPHQTDQTDTLILGSQTPEL